MRLAVFELRRKLCKSAVGIDWISVFGYGHWFWGRVNGFGENIWSERGLPLRLGRHRAWWIVLVQSVLIAMPGSYWLVGSECLYVFLL